MHCEHCELMWIYTCTKTEFNPTWVYLGFKGTRHIDFFKTFLQRYCFPQIRVQFFIRTISAFIWAINHLWKLHVTLIVVNMTLLLHKKWISLSEVVDDSNESLYYPDEELDPNLRKGLPLQKSFEKGRCEKSPPNSNVIQCARPGERLARSLPLLVIPAGIPKQDRWHTKTSNWRRATQQHNTLLR